MRSASDSNSGIVIATIRNFPFNLSLMETAAVDKNLKELSLEEQIIITMGLLRLLKLISQVP